ncbi:MAG: DUF58 domain-containing protein [Planctomycetes bacterium]|nr:DUF58 domain-containing protein [Planctomycetota bacterium]
MPATAPTAQELFDPEFLAAVSRFRILARRVARGGVHAEQRSRHVGAGMEFRDYRGYAPGDDLRAIDWNIYRRLGRVYLRLFEEFEDLQVYVAPDVSGSMWHGERPRAHAGLRASFALALAALNHHDSVGLFPFAEQLRVALPAGSGNVRKMRIAEALAAQTPGGRTDFVASLGRFARMGLRRGLLVVVSDFFDPGGIKAVRQSLSRQRHRLVLVQLVRKTDRDPDLTGDLLLRDCESGQEHDVSVTSDVLAAYRRAYEAHQEGLHQLALQQQAGLVQVDVDEPVLPQLSKLFETGALQV